MFNYSNYYRYYYLNTHNLSSPRMKASPYSIIVMINLGSILHVADVYHQCQFCTLCSATETQLASKPWRPAEARCGRPKYTALSPVF